MLDQAEFLRGHPIFNSNKSLDVSLDLSLNTFNNLQSSFRRGDRGSRDGLGRRSILALRESDLLLAVGNEIRIMSLLDAKTTGLYQRSYKTIYTPNIEFQIQQITVNQSGKLLAIAGKHQVAVISLPRADYSKLVPSKIDCRTAQIGQFYHATKSSPPVARIEWHPWGKNASTLLVMTTDGILREYDISIDPEEPQQILSFMPERSQTASFKGYSSSREVVSFCLGKGKANWGPLTVYALTKCGDIWAMCPFMPTNAIVPVSYINALEYFVRAKEERASKSEADVTNPSNGISFSTMYTHQLKYVLSLSKQIPEMRSSVLITQSRSVPIHAPILARSRPVRQGPFLFQPAPRELEDGQGDDATDLVYLTVGGTAAFQSDEEEVEEALGVFAVAFSDGKVDICLDVETVEAMWESNQLLIKDSQSAELPMVAVYETIDLGLVSMLTNSTTSAPTSLLGTPQASSEKLLDLLQLNHPVFVHDALYQDTVYLYHSFGVHCLNLSRWLKPLANSLRDGGESQMQRLLDRRVGTEVICMRDTFLVTSKTSYPIAGVTLPSDVYLSYSMFVITNALDMDVIELALRVEPLEESSKNENEHLPAASPVPHSSVSSTPGVEAGTSSIISLLSKEPYTPPPDIDNTAVDTVRKLALPANSKTQNIEITSELLRKFVTTVQLFQSRIRDIHVALRGLEDRVVLQGTELRRQEGTYVEIRARTDKLKGQQHEQLTKRFEDATITQKELLRRTDKMLQKLMDSSSPTLNEQEKRWFAELKRMKVSVCGEGSYDSSSLKARMDTLLSRLEYYLPRLKELSQYEKQRRQDEALNPVVLGREQEARLLMRLGEHKKMLSDVVKKTEEMAQRMNVQLEKNADLEYALSQ